MMMPFMFDDLYLLLVVPTIVLSMFAQFLVKSTFGKYSKVSSSKKITGVDATNVILQSCNISDVKVEAVAGTLSDHYHPGVKKIRLSEPVFGSTSIAALGVAAHEAGHAIQHNKKYAPLVLRSTLVPVANIGSQFGPVLAMAGLGLFFGADTGDSPLSNILFTVGILLYAGAILFYLITLPVEFNASNRAIAVLRANNILDEKELKGVKKVLTAAALTYVASALTAVMSLVRLILLSKRRRR